METAPHHYGNRRVIICAGTGCVASGAEAVYDAFLEHAPESGLSMVTSADLKTPLNADQLGVHLSKSGCQGFCQMGPLVTVLPENILYCKVTPDDVPEIVSGTLVKGECVERLLYRDPSTDTPYRGTHDIPFYTRQARTVLAQCGRIDPEDLQEYLDDGGYEAARKAFAEMTPAEVCGIVQESGLRGRGGGGFPTGRKWELTRIQESAKKYVICNGDEGDPGAFMDRSLMEGNPHRVLEGIMIAARGVGADEAFVYVRTEYPLAVKRLHKAVRDAEAAGLLGEQVFGTTQCLTCHVMEGAGAFVCGEETALIASVEGKRGMPSPKPPFPAQSGLWGKPTLINNVETLASVPQIVAEGDAAFRRAGTAASPGTKTFALTGHVANTGLIEVPMGTTLGRIVYDIGGGVTADDGSLTRGDFKAVQIGGPSGACLTMEHVDLPLDYDSLKAVGAMVGSGGLVVMNQDTCMVQVARFFMQFTQNESCGKCVPCREGTKQMLALLDDIIEGRADAATLDLLEKLGHAVSKSSLCGLGKTAPNPVLSTMRSFREEYDAHVFSKMCPTRRCKALVIPEIDPLACKGCTLCARACPVGAIEGKRKEVHRIDPDLCTRCGACAAACKFDAIIGV